MTSPTDLSRDLYRTENLELLADALVKQWGDMAAERAKQLAAAVQRQRREMLAAYNLVRLTQEKVFERDEATLTR